MKEISVQNKRLAKNSLFMTIRTVVILIVSLYITRLVLKLLGIIDYGVYNVVAGFVLLFSFLNNSMSSATQRFYNVELAKNGEEGAQLVYCTSLKIHIVLGLVIILIALPIGIWFIKTEMVLPQGTLTGAIWVFVCSLMDLFITIICVPFVAAVMAHERIDFLSMIEVLRTILRLIGVVLLFMIVNNRLIWYGIINTIISLIYLIGYIVFCRKKFTEIKFGAKKRKDFIPQMISFSGWSLGGSIGYVLRDQGVNLLLNFLYGPVVNAARGISNQVNGALQSFVGNLTTPARPQIIQSYSVNNRKRVWNLTFSLSKFSMLFFFMLSMPICIEIEYILRLWLGSQIPENTSIFVILLLITNTLGTLVFPISTVIQASGKIKLYQVYSSISNLMTIPLSYLFIRIYHLPSMAYVALFVTMLINVLVALWAARKYTSLNCTVFLSRVLMPCFIVIILSIPIPMLFFICLSSGIVRLIIIIVSSIVIVPSLSYYIALNRDEKRIIKEIITNKLQKI